MNELHGTGISLDVIANGRSVSAVIDEWLRAWDECKESLTEVCSGDEDLFTSTMQAVIYRIYLLGVEDGMKKEGKK